MIPPVEERMEHRFIKKIGPFVYADEKAKILAKEKEEKDGSRLGSIE